MRDSPSSGPSRARRSDPADALGTPAFVLVLAIGGCVLAGGWAIDHVRRRLPDPDRLRELAGALAAPVVATAVAPLYATVAVTGAWVGAGIQIGAMVCDELVRHRRRYPGPRMEVG